MVLVSANLPVLSSNNKEITVDKTAVLRRVTVNRDSAVSQARRG